VTNEKIVFPLRSTLATNVRMIIGGRTFQKPLASGTVS
jgi:hypothetical protein